MGRIVEINAGCIPMTMSVDGAAVEIDEYDRIEIDMEGRIVEFWGDSDTRCKRDGKGKPDSV